MPSKPLEPKTLAAIEPVEIEGRFFRVTHAKYRGELLSLKGSLQLGGRYNHKSEFGALYLGESEPLCHFTNISCESCHP
jgi:RES domain-containing protein